MNAMIELVTDRMYGRVDQHEGEQSLDESATARASPPRGRTHAVESIESGTTASSIWNPSSSPYRNYRESPTAAIDRLMLNFLFVLFLLAMSLIFGGGYVYVPFLIDPPTSHPPSAEGNSPSHISFYRPSLDPTPSPRIANTCPPPTATNGTILSKIFAMKLPKSRAGTDGIYLSDDASILVLADSHHPTIHCSHSCERGQIHTFGWDCDSQSYELLGEMNGSSPFQRMGLNIQLSSHGHVMAVESNGHVTVYQWQGDRWKATLKHVTLYPTSRGLGDKLPKFSMNKDGTQVAVISVVRENDIVVTLCQYDGQDWHENVFSASLPRMATEADKGDPLAISLADEGTALSLFGVQFGLLRASFQADSTLTVGESPLRFFPKEELDEDPHADWHSYSVSVSRGSAALYAYSSSGNDSFINIVEYRDEEWMARYNATWMPGLDVALTPRAGLLFRKGKKHFIILDKKGGWHVLTEDKHHEGNIDQATLSGDGKFLCILDENHDLNLYIVNSTL